MLFSDHMKDRYCQFTCNQNTGQFERDWIRYADGVYEPVRREGSLSAKWNDRHERCLWWHERKPADWRPWDDGFGFSWNHTLGEKNKPAGYGNKSEAEAAAGNAPYFMEIEPGADGRIASRTERIDGRRETWRFSYDGEGRLTSCLANNGWAQDFEYDEQGRRAADYAVGRQPFKRAFAYDDADRLLSVGNVAYEHDAQGFRSARIDGEAITRYHYAPDYRLLGAELPDGRIIEMEHNDNGQRIIKLVNGTPVEAYRWRDFVRLAGFLDGECEQEFLYADDSRLPYAVRINDTTLTLEYDQIGSLKAVVDETGNVVKAIQYDPFGILLWDSNPGLRIPLGFGGGLSDPDLGLVRFGWRDYDPDTGRWTAQDPIGDAGGDTDWYGYCLDDPINGVDPAGLARFGVRDLKGLPGLKNEGLYSIVGKLNPLGAIFDSSLQAIDDKENTKLNHEQLFFEDGSGDNIGFFKEGRKYNSENIDNYRLEQKHYEDKRMRRVNESIVPGDYNLCGVGGKKNNCQDFKDKLITRYNLFERGDKQR